MWKLVIGFFSGIALSGLLIFGIQSAIPARGQSENISGASDNFSLVNLLPDIEKIYRQALTTPLKEAEKKIYDQDVASFYHLLLQKTELDKD